MTSVLPGLNEEFMVDYIRRLALESRYRMIVNNVVQAGDSPFLEQKRRQQQDQPARIRDRRGDMPIG